MAVYTSITREELTQWLKRYSIGSLIDMQGILTGVENTNYFVTTTEGQFVLTIFELLQATELPFYLNFMAHLANHGIPCPRPVADLDDSYLGELCGKPASLVSKLRGRSVTAPSETQCARVGAMLANMHRAGHSFPPTIDNPRGTKWQRFAAEKVMPFLSVDERALLQQEMHDQAQRPAGLPRGVVHADLFRDNVLFEGEQVGGVIDFYFAGGDDWLFDLAVTTNDWCMTSPGVFDQVRQIAMLGSYDQVRALTDAEKRAWPIMLRAAALRFWLSRLYDFHLPRQGEMVIPHDPEHFRIVLDAHRRNRHAWPIG